MTIDCRTCKALSFSVARGALDAGRRTFASFICRCASLSCSHVFHVLRKSQYPRFFCFVGVVLGVVNHRAVLKTQYHTFIIINAPRHRLETSPRGFQVRSDTQRWTDCDDLLKLTGFEVNFHPWNRLVSFLLQMHHRQNSQELFRGPMHKVVINRRQECSWKIPSSSHLKAVGDQTTSLLQQVDV